MSSLPSNEMLPSRIPISPIASSPHPGKAMISPQDPLDSGCATLVSDWEELVDLATSRVFFYSEKEKLSRWGLPLDSLGQTEEEKQLLKGWCLHVDPSTGNKYFAHEDKSKAQWQPPESLKPFLATTPYLLEKHSWAKEKQASQHRPRPRSKDWGGSIASIPKPPAVRRVTLRSLIETVALHKVLCDREVFQAFQVFAATYHAAENVLFLCVAEAFAKRGSKVVDLLGLDDLAKSDHKGLPRTKSLLQQLEVDMQQAQETGITVDKVQMIREASSIFNRFLAPGTAPDWVCVDERTVAQIASILHDVRADATAPLDRDIFVKARNYIYQNLEHDLLPRFIKAVLSPPSDEQARSLKGIYGVFEPDEVLRHHLIQLQKSPDVSTSSLLSTANAYRSLHPSPRYAIEGREGSGLLPANLAIVSDEDVEEIDILTKYSRASSFARRSIAFKVSSPFSNRFFAGSTDESHRPLKRTVSRKSANRSSQRTTSSPNSPNVRVRERSRSKSEIELDEDILAAKRHEQINLDAHEFEVRVA